MAEAEATVPMRFYFLLISLVFVQLDMHNIMVRWKQHPTRPLIKKEYHKHIKCSVGCCFQRTIITQKENDT
ncbi:MAG: hypothetical protein DRG30_05225 [Epsilonproteobacteria bacterium]|nr:MAG: hypothetical protein DRG30_05225 [Campylobacterota bacterium]